VKVILCIFLLLVFVQGVQAAPDSLANPASVNCGKVGATSEIMNNPDGSQYGMCKFPNGTACEEWALFRGEGCKPNVAPVTTTSSAPTILQTTIKTATPTSTTDNDAKIAALEKQIAEQNKKIDQQGNILDQITNLLRNIFGWNIVTPTPIPATSPTPTSTPLPTTLPSVTPTSTPQIIDITATPTQIPVTTLTPTSTLVPTTIPSWTPTQTPTPQIIYITVTPTPTPTPSVTISIPQTTTAPAVPTTGVYVRISYIGVWKGTYGMPAALQTVDKSGDQFYEIENAKGPVQATFEKLDGSTRHELVVEIYKNGQLLTSGKTSDAFGKVTASADATTGVAQIPTPIQTPNPTPVTTTLATLTPTLTPGPTQTLPDMWSLDVQVVGNGEAVNPQIITTVMGGNGLSIISQLDVKVTRSDGVMETGIIAMPLYKGKSVSLPSTTAPGYRDRAEVWATTPQGDKVKIYDAYVPFRTYN